MHTLWILCKCMPRFLYKGALILERYIGLDVGTKTVGVAVSDPLGITAQPVETIIRKSNKEDFQAIKDYIDKYQIKTVVVGMPYNMNGTVGPSGEMAKKFGEKIKNKYGVNVVYIDERNTTKLAEQVLIKGNVRRENRKKHIDKIAAVFILETYLSMI